VIVEKVWNNIWIRFFVAIALIALFLWLSYVLRQILIPLTLAFIVAYIFDPLVDVFENRKIPRTLTIGILLVIIIAGFAAVLLIIVPSLIRQSIDLVHYLQESYPDIKKNLEETIARFSGTGLAERLSTSLEGMLEALKARAPQMLESAQSVLAGLVSGTVGFVGAIVNFILFAVVSVYLLKDFDRITTKIEELIPPSRKEYLLGVMQKTNTNLRSFFRGQLIVCTILAAIYAIGLTIVGVPFALLIAIAGGYGQIVPYLGTALGIVPAAVLALIKFGDIWHPLAAIAVFAIGQSLEGFIITPKIVGDKVGLHPVVIILAILIFGKLLGFLGVLFAVPLAAIMKVMLGELITRYKKSEIFSGSNE
jgi:predicted PurR-regulated permease PerM